MFSSLSNVPIDYSWSSYPSTRFSWQQCLAAVHATVICVKIWEWPCLQTFKLKEELKSCSHCFLHLLLLLLWLDFMLCTLIKHIPCWILLLKFSCLLPFGIKNMVLKELQVVWKHQISSCFVLTLIQWGVLIRCAVIFNYETFSGSFDCGDFCWSPMDFQFDAGGVYCKCVVDMALGLWLAAGTKNSIGWWQSSLSRRGLLDSFLLRL